MSLLTNIAGWFRFGGFALGDRSGTQLAAPSSALVSDTRSSGADGALQVSAVWACVQVIAGALASLPVFVYRERGDGLRDLARDSALWTILHDSPNRMMTPVEFWTAITLNLLLKGNAYARIDRTAAGEAYALTPMSSDQVEMRIMADGTVVYLYSIGSDVAVLAESSVCHFKGMGNGTIGLSRLDYMRATTDEAANAQTTANRLFANGGKPTGVLMIDQVLNKEQRDRVKQNFEELATSTTSRLFVLEANMKYQQVNLSPNDLQLLATRQFTVEEICRWFGVPPVMVGHANVTTWGSGVEQILDGFHKLTIRPAIVAFEQAIRKRVLTPNQRAQYSVEFSIDALLRSNIKDRFEVYSKAVQNGLKTRNECRQLENDPPIAGGDELTAQTNLVPLDKLGQITATTTPIPEQPITNAARLIDMETKATEQATQHQRHAETLAMIKAIADKPAEPVHVDLANAIIHVTRAETLPAPTVQVSNFVNPTPVEVNVSNEVNPTPVTVEAQFEATVQPAEVNMNLNLTQPPRRTESTVKRNDKGEIVSTTTVERDA